MKLSPEYIEELRLACAEANGTLEYPGFNSVPVDENTRLLCTPQWGNEDKSEGVIPCYFEEDDGKIVGVPEEYEVTWTGDLEKDLQIWMGTVSKALAEGPRFKSPFAQTNYEPS